MVHLPFVDASAHAQLKPLVVAPKVATQLLSCSHTKLYELLASGEIDSFKDGKSRKIVVASIEDYVARQLRK